MATHCDLTASSTFVFDDIEVQPEHSKNREHRKSRPEGRPQAEEMTASKLYKSSNAK